MCSVVVGKTISCQYGHKVKNLLNDVNSLSTNKVKCVSSLFAWKILCNPDEKLSSTDLNIWVWLTELPP